MNGISPLITGIFTSHSAEQSQGFILGKRTSLSVCINSLSNEFNHDKKYFQVSPWGHRWGLEVGKKCLEARHR
jgi:hypothetical protein